MRYIISLMFTALLAMSMPLYAVDDSVNVNNASAAELETELGVTETIAKRIVEYREKYGPFATKDDLLKVEGIERDLLNMHKHNINVERYREKDV